MRQNLQESSIPMELKTTINTQCSYDWDPDDTTKFFEALFTTISKYLSSMKSTSKKKTALKFEDYKGNMLMAAIVSYHEKEDNDMVGNWSYTFTFDPEDLKDVETVLEYNNMGFQSMLADITLQMHHYRYATLMFETNLTQFSIRELINCLDKNASAEEVFEIELPGYFVASVAIENGEKVMAIEPSAKMNQLIKGDELISEYDLDNFAPEVAA